MVNSNISPASNPTSSGSPSESLSQRTFADRALAAIWRLNFAVVLVAAVWIFVDPLAPRILGGVERKFLPPTDNPADGSIESRLDRTLGFVGLAAFAAVSLVALVASLFFGPARHRAVRSWLALTALVALWLGLAVSWREFAWAGDRWRLAHQLESFEKVAAGLRAAWPTTDGKFPDLGQFSAYPIGKPKTLLMNSVDAPPGRAPVVAVERSRRGALRFQLGGDQTGDWLEWRPVGSRPASFTSGLETHYKLDRASPLGDGWYLVRYR